MTKMSQNKVLLAQKLARHFPNKFVEHGVTYFERHFTYLDYFNEIGFHVRYPYINKPDGSGNAFMLTLDHDHAGNAFLGLLSIIPCNNNAETVDAFAKMYIEAGFSETFQQPATLLASGDALNIVCLSQKSLQSDPISFTYALLFGDKTLLRVELYDDPSLSARDNVILSAELTEKINHYGVGDRANHRLTRDLRALIFEKKNEYQSDT